MGKLLALLWLPVSIAVTALAVANIIEYFHPGTIQWMAPFGQALKYYAGFAKQMSTPLTDFVHQQANIGVPAWAPDGVVAYTASATGFAMAGSNLTDSGEELHALKSSAASMGWPLAIITFAFTAFRNHEISKFAGQHTTLFVLYLAAVGAVLAGAVWGQQLLPTHGV